MPIGDCVSLVEDSHLGCLGRPASQPVGSSVRYSPHLLVAMTGKMPVCRDRLEAYLPKPLQ